MALVEKGAGLLGREAFFWRAKVAPGAAFLLKVCAAKSCSLRAARIKCAAMSLLPEPLRIIGPVA